MQLCLQADVGVFQYMVSGLLIALKFFSCESPRPLLESPMIHEQMEMDKTAV